MLRGRLHFDRGNVATIWRCSDLLLLQLLLGKGLLLLFEEVTLAPVNLLRVIDLCLFNRLALLCVNLLRLLFGLVGLIVADFLVLLFRVVVQLTGSLVTGFTHLLPHNLTKSTISSSVSEGTFRCLCSLLFCLSNKVLNLWSLKVVSYGWLPLD